MKNVGAASEQIIAERQENGHYQNYADLSKRLTMSTNANKSVYESLIYSGALDEFEGTRQAKLNVAETMIDMGKREKERKKTGRVSLLNWIIDNKANEVNGLQEFFNLTVEEVEEMEKRVKLEKEYEVAGFYITEHPIDRFAHILAQEYTQAISLLLESDEDESEDGTVFEDTYKTSSDGDGETMLMDDEVDKKLSDGDIVNIAGIIKEFELKHTKKDNKSFAVFKLEDRSGIVKVVLFAKEYERYSKVLGDGKIVKLTGRFKKTDFGVEVHGIRAEDLELREGQNKLTRIDVRSVTDLDTARQQYIALLSVAKSSPGDISVYFHNQVNGIVYEMPEKLHSTNHVLEQINAIFGMDNIAFS